MSRLPSLGMAMAVAAKATMDRAEHFMVADRDEMSLTLLCLERTEIEPQDKSWLRMFVL